MNKPPTAQQAQAVMKHIMDAFKSAHCGPRLTLVDSDPAAKRYTFRLSGVAQKATQ